MYDGIIFDIEKYFTDRLCYGDTRGDYDACEKAGVPMIFASYGLGTVKKPEKIVKSISELLTII